MLKRGFTIVELIIIITVMGILLVLGVVNLSSSQVNARDAERKSDIETIAMHLETFYNFGTDYNSGNQATGRYPSVEEMNSLANQIKTLRDIDPKALNAPGQTVTSLIAQGDSSGITKDKYIYIPKKIDGATCQYDENECTKFTLVYRKEQYPDPIQVESKNQ